MKLKAKEKITKLTVKRLAMDEGEKDQIIWDSELQGFGVRRTPKGKIAFILDYSHRAKRHRMVIGNHPEYEVEDAREEAMAARVDLKNGIDPLEARQEWKAEPTFSALAQSFMKKSAKHKRAGSLYHDRRHLTKFILPAIGEKRLSEIKQRDISRIHESLSDTPYQANRTLALMSTVFNHGIAEKLITENPAKGVKKYPEERRERWLTVEEIQRFREALDRYSDQNAANALRLLLLTGSRVGEVLGATWDEFDLPRATWTKSSHRTKQRRKEHVPLSGEAVKLLQSMARENNSGPLFPGKRYITKKGKNIGKSIGKEHRVAIKRPWIFACREAGLTEEYTVQGKTRTLTRHRPTLRVHDIRHSFCSHLISNGVGLQVVGRLVGHSTAATTMRYAHIADAALRGAVDQVSRIYRQGAKTAAKKRRAK